MKNIYHVQNVNAFHNRLKNWMRRFNDIARKRQDNYLIWFRFQDADSKQVKSAKMLELFRNACLPISYYEIQRVSLTRRPLVPSITNGRYQQKTRHKQQRLRLLELQSSAIPHKLDETLVVNI